MKNVTLSMPESLIEKCRDYAKRHGTTLNQMIRDLLAKQVNDGAMSRSELIDTLQESLSLETKNFRFNREELYDR